MTGRLQLTFWAKPGLVRHLAKIGEAALVLGPVEPARPIRLYDTFDGQIAVSGRVLLSMMGGLWLFGGDKTLAQFVGASGFVADMAEGPVTEALSGCVSPLRRLLMLGEGTLSRQSLALRDDQGDVRLEGDLSRLSVPGGKDVLLCSLRALPGKREIAERICHELRAEARPLTALEAEARLRAVVPEALGPGGDFGLRAKDRALDAAQRILRRQLAAARRQEPGILADLDTEFLHDYRVALRRARSCVSLFQGVLKKGVREDLGKRLAALMAPTGPLRDLDVYLMERGAFRQLVPETQQHGLERVFDELAREREDAHQALADWLGSDGYAAEMEALKRAIAHGLAPGPEAKRDVRKLARRLIRERHAKLREVAQGLTADTSDQDIHRLRIQGKKLRYLMEFFADLFDAGDMRKLVKALKRLQDCLGTFNDLSVQRAALARLEAPLAARGDVEAVAALDALREALALRQAEARAQVEARFARFDGPGTRKRMARLFGGTAA